MRRAAGGAALRNATLAWTIVAAGLSIVVLVVSAAGNQARLNGAPQVLSSQRAGAAAADPIARTASCIAREGRADGRAVRQKAGWRAEGSSASHRGPQARIDITGLPAPRSHHRTTAGRLLPPPPLPPPPPSHPAGLEQSAVLLAGSREAQCLPSRPTCSCTTPPCAWGGERPAPAPLGALPRCSCSSAASGFSRNG